VYKIIIGVSTPQPEQLVSVPTHSSLEVDIFFRNQPFQEAWPAYLLQRAEGGYLHIDQTQEGYTLRATGKKTVDPYDFMLSTLLEPTGGEAWPLPPPPTSEAIRDAKKMQSKPVSGLLQAGVLARRHLVAEGYVRSAGEGDRAAEKARRTRYVGPAVGAVTGSLIGVASKEPMVGMIAFLLPSLAIMKAQNTLYHIRARKYAKLMVDNRFTPKGEAEMADLKAWQQHMQAAAEGTQPLTPERSRELLPYATVLGLHRQWLGTQACKSAFAKHPKWLTPLEPASTTPMAAMEQFIDYCINSAFQPGKLNLIQYGSSRKHWEQAWKAARLDAFADAVPELPPGQ
jgi:hypothetical protein